MDLNIVVISGRLTRDPELRHTPAGKSVLDLNIAINRFYHNSNSNGEIKETTFIKVIVWDDRAEICAKCLRKGSIVAIEGRLEQERRERDGNKFIKTSVIANNIQFLSGICRKEERQYGQGKSDPDHNG